MAHRTVAAAHARRLKLYTRLRVAAANGELCPDNPALMAVTGFQSGSGVARGMRDLIDEGAIEVEQRGNLRRVTICATGEKTAAFCIDEPLAKPKRPVREIAAVAIELSNGCRKDILGRSRFREHVRVRQVISDFAVREGWGATHVARILGFDHSTVNYSRKALPLHAAREPETAALIAEMARQLPPLTAAEMFPDAA